MARVAGCLVVLLLAGSPLVRAQETGSTAPIRPRVEIGAGCGVFSSGGTLTTRNVMVQARGGVRIAGGWSVETLLDFDPQAERTSGFYRVRAQWRIGRQPLQPFLAVGAAGEFYRYHRPEYRWTDSNGRLYVYPEEKGTQVGAPIYPTVGFGVERILTSHLALRAELGVAFGVSDYGIAVAWLPTVGVSIPIGRYRK